MEHQKLWIRWRRINQQLDRPRQGRVDRSRPRRRRMARLACAGLISPWPRHHADSPFFFLSPFSLISMSSSALFSTMNFSLFQPFFHQNNKLDQVRTKEDPDILMK
jgi:hypothetical protein